MKIILLRHSTTPGNELRRYIGSTDEPLSESGIRIAQKFGELPLVKKVFVSPLLRTGQTAKLIFPNAEQRVVFDLREMDFGIFERKSADDMQNDPVYRSWVEGGCKEVCPEGEGITDFSVRTCDAFRSVILDEARKGSMTVFFVVHGGNIMAIMDRLTVRKQDYFSWSVKNCCGWYINASVSSDDILLDDFRRVKSSQEIEEALSK